MLEVSDADSNGGVTHPNIDHTQCCLTDETNVTNWIYF
jgi:hypothetical protein